MMPSAAELEHLLGPALSPRLATDGIALLRRTWVGQGSFPKEILTLSVDGRKVELFCKYEGGFDHSSHGHRGGVGYEARVYEEILAPSGSSTPKMILAHRPADRADTWLFLEYLSEAIRVSKATEPCAMAQVAEWIGRFHARATASDVPAFVRRYDHDYYRGWVQRTDARVREGGGVGEWWPRALRCFAGQLDVLGECEPSLLHGEYYPKNVLWAPDRVSPVDWESAAVGAGPIDLVSLVDGWPDPLRRRCTDAYVRGRWQLGAPSWFWDQCSLAEVYLHLRWLGDDAWGRQGTQPAREWPRVRRIGELAKSLGWV
jgi:hypothetical protein